MFEYGETNRQAPDYSDMVLPPLQGNPDLAQPHFLPVSPREIPEVAATPVTSAAGTEHVPPEPYNPWRMKQIHYMEGDRIEGDHPNDTARRLTDEWRSELMGIWEKNQQALGHAPDRNAEYEPTIAHGRELLVQAFGPALGSRLIKVVDVEAGRAHGLLSAGNVGHIMNGHLVVGFHSQFAPHIREREVLNTILHEGAHTRHGTDTAVVTSLHEVDSHDADGVPHMSFTPFEVPLNRIIEFTAYPDQPPMAGGYFFEEAVVESYRARTVTEALGSNELTGTIMLAGTEDTPYTQAYTDGRDGHPPYDPAQKCVYVPWQYASSAFRYKGRNMIQSSTASMAAYGLDLLDEQLPGIRDEITSYGNNPDVRHHIEERIDGIEAGLFQKLFLLPYTKAAFHGGLSRIARALGMTGTS